MKKTIMATTIVAIMLLTMFGVCFNASAEHRPKIPDKPTIEGGLIKIKSGVNIKTRETDLNIVPKPSSRMNTPVSLGFLAWA